MRTRLLALALLWAPLASATAQQTAPVPRPADRVAAAVDPSVLRAHLEFLADDALEGRRPGTRGGKLAARYIAAQFQRLGLESGMTYVGRPATYGKEKKDEYVAQRYHQPSDEVLPWFTYDGAAQQVRVIVRTAVAVANAPSQPVWNRTSEFRDAGEKRREGK